VVHLGVQSIPGVPTVRRPNSVCIPVATTTPSADPSVTVVPRKSMFSRSANGRSFSIGSVRFPTGTDSPANAASSTRRLLASIKRRSAGTTSPASCSTMSPGTKASATVSACGSESSRFTGVLLLLTVAELAGGRRGSWTLARRTVLVAISVPPPRHAVYRRPWHDILSYGYVDVSGVAKRFYPPNAPCALEMREHDLPPRDGRSTHSTPNPGGLRAVDPTRREGPCSLCDDRLSRLGRGRLVGRPQVRFPALQRPRTAGDGRRQGLGKRDESVLQAVHDRQDPPLSAGSDSDVSRGSGGRLLPADAGLLEMRQGLLGVRFGEEPLDALGDLRATRRPTWRMPRA